LHDLAAIEDFSRIAEHHGEGDHDPARAGFSRARISTLRSLDVQVESVARGRRRTIKRRVQPRAIVIVKVVPVIHGHQVNDRAFRQIHRLVEH
jgi:hypothetical protein